MKLKGWQMRWLWPPLVFLALALALYGLDRLFPLPLREVQPARVVVAEDGTPLWQIGRAHV